MRDGDFTTGLTMLSVLVGLIAGMFYAAHQRDELKEQAVKRGLAEWVVSSAGEAKWQWKEVAK